MTQATQTAIDHELDVDELLAMLTDARTTIVAQAELIEQLDPAEHDDTMESLLRDAERSLRRIRQVTGPIEALGTGLRSDVEQLATTALDSIADALARLNAAPF